MDKKIKVLLADNSEHFGQPCAQVMRTHGLDVQTVQKDGKQVAEEIGRAHPDVVILDFFLPRMDAIGVMKNADSQGLTHKPQFMVMSSFDNPNLEREALLAGADYYFLKPFDSDEMAERIMALNSKPAAPAVKRLPVTPASQNDSLEMRVTEIIHQIGVPAHIKRISIFAGRYYYGHQRRRYDQCRYQTLISGGGQKTRHYFLPGGARHSPCHRGGMGPGRRGYTQFLLRLYDSQRPGETHQLRIYRHDFG